MTQPQTLFDKIWKNHIVMEGTDAPSVIYIDTHLVHEVTSPQAFSTLKARSLKVRRPERTFATIDHSIPTRTAENGGGRLFFADEMSRKQIFQMEENCRDFGIQLFGTESPGQGVVHIIGPELGITQPGMTIVCGDSHTATHGAFGALAFGIGTSEVAHVLATQCLLQYKPKNMQVRIEGQLAPGVTAKDVILALIAQIGVAGGAGYVLEYCGSTIRSMQMEERMTICNMSIEAGARAGLIAPDHVTYQYLKGRQYAPQGGDWDREMQSWQKLTTDEGAIYDQSVYLDASQLEPMVTFGTNPGMGIKISETVPDPQAAPSNPERNALEKALAYMDLQAGQSLLGHPLDVVFIGSCTNGRISDLRQAATMLRGRRIYAGMRVLVVPGSHAVKAQAEKEGLDQVFKAAGAEWREPGCSMCIAMNGDQLEPGQYAVSTSNRNFEGRQGKGGRTFLASPLTAAASALAGRVADARVWIGKEVEQ